MPKIQVRRGTTAQWNDRNPVLADGEIGFVTSGTDKGKYKIGIEGKTWNSLDWATSGAQTPTPFSLTVSDVFTATDKDGLPVSSFNGGAAVTLSLPATINRNAATATALQTARSINGTTFDGTQNPGVVIRGAIFGANIPAANSANFRNVFVSTTEPSGAVDGDVWIAY